MEDERLIELLIKTLDGCIQENGVIYMDSHIEEKELEAMLIERRGYVYDFKITIEGEQEIDYDDLNIAERTTD